MNALMEQFLIEGRECLEVMSTRLLELERSPDDHELLDDLFRRMHTLKGNSGLFPDLGDFIQVVHAGEDLLDALREGSIRFSGGLADLLFESLDLIARMLDRIGESGTLDEEFHPDAERVVTALRELLARELSGGAGVAASALPATRSEAAAPEAAQTVPAWFSALPEDILSAALARALQETGEASVRSAVCYEPEPSCYFKGEDPLLLVRQTPGLAGMQTEPVGPWPEPGEFDPYRSNLRFTLLSSAPVEDLRQHFRYVEDQIELYVPEEAPAAAERTTDSLPGADLSAALAVPAVAVPPEALRADVESMSEEEHAHFERMLAAQALLLVPGDAATRQGRWRAAARVAEALAARLGAEAALAEISRTLERALLDGDATPLATAIGALDAILAEVSEAAHRQAATAAAGAATAASGVPPTAGRGAAASGAAAASSSPNAADGAQRGTSLTASPTGGRASAASVGDAAGETMRGEEEHVSGESGPRVLRVRQEKIDRLMDLVGEMVVAKNALPYLAARAEGLAGARDLAREIKAHYQVINRISEELQDSIMQVRMLPVSSVFQRFPRLVRDVSRKLGKLVTLEIVGEETEADKNIIESLADPLIHILRNSLDHGIEAPAAREAAGKPAQGTIRIHAYQESDRVIIEINDDGRGIDPDLVRRKAYERGVVDEARLAQLSDHEAIQLVFAPGFSTNDTVSELSGRGVGMDVVRRAVERVNGTVNLESTQGQGTRIRVVLPLSMAVTSVMLVRSADQSFGMPMDLVVETVRVPRTGIHTIKRQRTAVLRGRIVPLFSLNDLLGIPVEQQLNGDGELAVLVARIGGEHIGVVVDDFDETLDIILKPLDGVLAGLIGYAGTALLGDGSVLMVLNVKELL